MEKDTRARGGSSALTWETLGKWFLFALGSGDSLRSRGVDGFQDYGNLARKVRRALDIKTPFFYFGKIAK